MGTSVYQGRTTVSELRDMIRKLGGVPKGSTKAQLQDQLEGLLTNGGVSPEDVRRIVEDSVAEQLPEAIGQMGTSGLSDDDLDDIFAGA